MDFVNLLLYCPQYRPLLGLLVLGLALIVIAISNSEASSGRTSNKALRRTLSDYADQFNDIHRSAYEDRRETANNYVQDIKDILRR